MAGYIKFPLDDDMGNGATVSDWLGTAASAAHRAVGDIMSVRDMPPDDNLNMIRSQSRLVTAQQLLQQSLKELDQIIAHVEMVRERERAGK